ncbi:MAG: RNA-binding S4 domain-containing protein [Deferribacteraceae bacterium]|jgi:ribosomal 50S subunit-recycling heat shock protein|nr:RNA-binding S4 domain-containing protein [Deferribacteraceae bacterium]
MRLDKFLKLTGLIKRRPVAKESADEGVIRLNGRTAKASAEVKAGDKLEIDMWNYYKAVDVLKVPTAGSIPKVKIDEYINVAEYRTKEV